jgi:hypothetical protein
MNVIVVEVGATQEPGEQALGALDGLDHQAAVTGDERDALGPARRHIDHCQRLDEGARRRGATARHHVDLAEARRWIVPVIEGPDRNLAADHRVEPHAPPPTARCSNLHIAEQTVDGRRAHDSTIVRSLSPSCNRPCRSSDSSNVGIITISRLPQTRSEASVIDTRHPARIRRQQRLDHTPFEVGQVVARHDPISSAEHESRSR